MKTSSQQLLFECIIYFILFIYLFCVDLNFIDRITLYFITNSRPTEGSLLLRIKLLQLFFLFSYYAREFIERIPEKRLTSQKMDCIHHMVKTKLFEDQGRHSLKLASSMVSLQMIQPKKKLKKKSVTLRNNKYHVKVLLKRFHFNGHIIGFRPQTQKLELLSK